MRTITCEWVQSQRQEYKKKHKKKFWKQPTFGKYDFVAYEKCGLCDENWTPREKNWSKKHKPIHVTIENNIISQIENNIDKGDQNSFHAVCAPKDYTESLYKDFYEKDTDLKKVTSWALFNKYVDIFHHQTAVNASCDGSFCPLCKEIHVCK